MRKTSAILHISRRPEHGAASPILVACILVLIGTIGQSAARTKLEAIRPNTSANDQPPLYLPSPAYVRLVTMGFDNFASDILWFNTINYFGKELRGGKDYKWLGHMCELVTNLDKRKQVVYEFCANMLAWEAKDFQRSIELLTRAIEALPHQWRPRYLRGFNYWYFLDRKDLAQEDLTAASHLPNAPSFLAVLASRLMTDNKSPEAAIDFLQNLRENTTDENARRVLEEKIKRGVISRDIRNLTRLVDRFLEKHGKRPDQLQDLVAEGLLNYIPKDPFGGDYVIDPESGIVKTASGEKGLEFLGRTKDTGIFGMENAKPAQPNP